MDGSDKTMVLNAVIRMVVPMRREFGRSLDVQQFMHDPAYARAVLEQALGSRDERLREYAQYVQRHLGGAREVDAPRAPQASRAEAAPAAASGAPAAGPADAVSKAAPAAEETEAELRARMLRKYTGGLR